MSRCLIMKGAYFFFFFFFPTGWRNSERLNLVDFLLIVSYTPFS